jgi:hypothetical protein
LPSSLLERRPDLRQAEAILVGATANVRVAKAALFPTISLNRIVRLGEPRFIAAVHGSDEDFGESVSMCCNA